MKIPKDTYVICEAWMVTELGLTGLDLLLFALIYGFSTGPAGKFWGSRAFMAAWMGCSVSTVDVHLEHLTACGCIEKSKVTEDGTEKICYSVSRYPSDAPAVDASAAENGAVSGAPALFSDDSAPVFGVPAADSGAGGTGKAAAAGRNPDAGYTESGAYIPIENPNDRYPNTRARGARPAGAREKRRTGERGTRKSDTISSFNTDDFFEAAVRRTFGDEYE